MSTKFKPLRSMSPRQRKKWQKDIENLLALADKIGIPATETIDGELVIETQLMYRLDGTGLRFVKPQDIWPAEKEIGKFPRY